MSEIRPPEHLESQNVVPINDTAYLTALFDKKLFYDQKLQTHNLTFNQLQRIIGLLNEDSSPFERSETPWINVKLKQLLDDGKEDFDRGLNLCRCCGHIYAVTSYTDAFTNRTPEDSLGKLCKVCINPQELPRITRDVLQVPNSS